MNLFSKITFLTFGTVAFLAIGCKSTPAPVHREDPNKDSTLSTRFGMSDARITATQLINDCLAREINGRNWTDVYRAEHQGRNPIIAVGEVVNKTDSRIQTQQVTTRVEEELLNSGRVRVIAERDLREQLRIERTDTKFTDPAFIKKVQAEHAADYILTGEILYAFETDGTRERADYQVAMQLIDLETLQKVWIRSAEVAKAR